MSSAIIVVDIEAFLFQHRFEHSKSANLSVNSTCQIFKDLSVRATKNCFIYLSCELKSDMVVLCVMQLGNFQGSEWDVATTRMECLGPDCGILRSCLSKVCCHLSIAATVSIPR
jgi:hypothetical protein